MRGLTGATVVLFGAFLFGGCGASVSSYRYDEHVIRIDRSEGAANARVYVDECPVEGMYYDRVRQEWGVAGYTYGPGYWELEDLAEDMASWGAARCDDPNGRVTRRSLASR